MPVLDASGPVTLERVGLFAEGVAVRRIGDETFRLGSRPQVVTMPRREPVTTLNEELRRLSPDLVYQEVLAAFAADHGCRVATPGTEAACSND